MQEGMDFFGQHLVCLGVTYVGRDAQGRRTGPERFFGASGFVMSFRDEWFFITAGHVFDQMEEIEVLRTSLIAYAGPRRATPIPIPFGETFRFHIDDRELGLDVGILHVRDLFRQSLEGFGTRAIGEEQWRHLHRVQCDAHFMIGYPAIYTSGELPPGRLGEEMDARMEAVMISLRERHELPEGSGPSELPWFVGQLPERARDFDIAGMSGCPIFGVRQNSDGTSHYWIVALQSRRSNTDRLAILGCPVAVFAPRIEYAFMRLDAEMADEET
jgi:hypothetical protein